MSMDLPNNEKISLKGSANKLKVIIPESMPEEMMWKELDHTALDASNLFTGVDLVINLGGRVISKDFLLRFLKDFVIAHDIRISSWEANDESSRESILSMGLNLSRKDIKQSRRSARRSETLVIHSSLRSGQRIEHDGDVLIIGHVNDGAEVIAEGNVSVMGKLKGLVHAGYNSEEDRAIIAASFETKQVRLGTKVSTLSEEADFWGRYVIVSPEKGSLLFKELKI